VGVTERTGVGDGREDERLGGLVGKDGVNNDDLGVASDDDLGSVSDDDLGNSDGGWS
jgi:hypothetical protein